MFAAVLVLHELQRGRRHPGARPAPAGVDKAGHLPLRVPQHDRIAIRVGREQHDARAVGHEGIDVVDGRHRGVDAGHIGSMHGADGGELGPVQA